MLVEVYKSVEKDSGMVRGGIRTSRWEDCVWGLVSRKEMEWKSGKSLLNYVLQFTIFNQDKG